MFLCSRKVVLSVNQFVVHITVPSYNVLEICELHMGNVKS